jgi:hypothetical protein
VFQFFGVGVDNVVWCLFLDRAWLRVDCAS